MFVPSEVPKLALTASCVSMRSPTEAYFKREHCAKNLWHINSFSSLRRLNKWFLFACPYLPTIPQRDSLQAASWKALCAPIRQLYLILHTATSKLINNQTYHGLRFWKLIPYSILPILHHLHQNHCLIKNANRQWESACPMMLWKRILANLHKWPYKGNKTLERVRQHHSPKNPWHQAIRGNFWHLQCHGYAPAPVSCWQTVLNDWRTLKWSSNDLQ